MHRVFLLSPALLSGKRAGHLLGDDARSPLAARLRSGTGASIAEVFCFVSGLYFRGKLEYASAFASPHLGGAGIHVIVPGLGLRSPNEIIDFEQLRAIANVPVVADQPAYYEPLRLDVRALSQALPPRAEVVLLGSIATSKYMAPLAEGLGDRLRVPRELIGLGMMSRGSLLRRCAKEGRELAYVPSA